MTYVKATFQTEGDDGSKGTITIHKVEARHVTIETIYEPPNYHTSTRLAWSPEVEKVVITIERPLRREDGTWMTHEWKEGE